MSAKSILVEQDGAPAIVSHMQAAREEVLIEVLDGFL